MIMLKVYNTLTRKEEEFKTLNEKEVKMYVCGPTVYDHTHLGHGRTYVSFDIIRRYLEHIGYSVNLVINFTDIDDKIIKRANETGKTSKELSEQFINVFLKDMTILKVKPADIIITSYSIHYTKLYEESIESCNVSGPCVIDCSRAFSSACKALVYSLCFFPVK